MNQSDEAKRQRFLLETEQAVRATNRDIIHQRIPKLTQAHVLDFAAIVAGARARYLEAAFQVSGRDDTMELDGQNLDKLRQNRQTYEETRAAFEALTRAIERGYVDLEDD